MGIIKIIAIPVGGGRGTPVRNARIVDIALRLMVREIVLREIRMVPTSPIIAKRGFTMIHTFTTHIPTSTLLSKHVLSIPTTVIKLTSHGDGQNKKVTENQLKFSESSPRIHLLLTDQNYSNMVLTNEVFQKLVKVNKNYVFLIEYLF